MAVSAGRLSAPALTIVARTGRQWSESSASQPAVRMSTSNRSRMEPPVHSTATVAGVTTVSSSSLAASGSAVESGCVDQASGYTGHRYRWHSRSSR